MQWAKERNGETLTRDFLTSAGAIVNEAAGDPVVGVSAVDALMKGDVGSVEEQLKMGRNGSRPGYLARTVATASTAKHSWFKSISGGEALAKIALSKDESHQTESHKQYLDRIRDWCAPIDA